MALKIIVTGAAGFIGSHTTDHLLAAGHAVWGVDNFRTGFRSNLATAKDYRNFLLIEADAADAHSFVQIVAAIKPDVIIHLAALVSVPESIADPALNERLNVHATRVVVEAARHSGVRRVVFASSAAVYGHAAPCPIAEDAPKQPLSPYGQAKLASEKLLIEGGAAHGFVARCQRYFNVYGPRQYPGSPYSGVISIFNDHAGRGVCPTIFGDGQQTRDFISVHDVARANVIAATRPGLACGVVNICTGQPVTLNALWSLIARGHLLDLHPQYGPRRAGDILHSFGCPAAASAEMGFYARISLAEGLSQYVAATRP